MSPKLWWVLYLQFRCSNNRALLLLLFVIYIRQTQFASVISLFVFVDDNFNFDTMWNCFSLSSERFSHWNVTVIRRKTCRQYQYTFISQHHSIETFKYFSNWNYHKWFSYVWMVSVRCRLFWFTTRAVSPLFSSMQIDIVYVCMCDCVCVCMWYCWLDSHHLSR